MPHTHCRHCHKYCEYVANRDGEFCCGRHFSCHFRNSCHCTSAALLPFVAWPLATPSSFVIAVRLLAFLFFLLLRLLCMLLLLLMGFVVGFAYVAVHFSCSIARYYCCCANILHSSMLLHFANCSRFCFCFCYCLCWLFLLL